MEQSVIIKNGTHTTIGTHTHKQLVKCHAIYTKHTEIVLLGVPRHELTQNHVEKLIDVVFCWTRKKA